MEKTANPHSPLRRGVGFGGAVFVVVIIGTTLCQFFLQLALAPEFINTSEFWIQGILSGLVLGVTLGILPAVLIGFLVWSKIAPIKTQAQQKNGLVTHRESESIRDNGSSDKQNAEGATAESARYKRNIIGFALILFVPNMFIWVWLLQ
jgi:hypothetical protein